MEISKKGLHLVVPGDYLKTLENCEGYYQCPLDENGKPLGPVVGYTADYDVGDGSKKKWVGLTYYNFSKADVWPEVLSYFAAKMVCILEEKGLAPDLIVGAPWAGIKFSQEVARQLGCRHIFAEKKGEEIILGRYEGEIHPNDYVLIGEELVNNLSTTWKLMRLIESVRARVIGIACAVNRSHPLKTEYWDAGPSGHIPVVSVIERETPQYRQDDPVVAEAISSGNFVPKPKYGWAKLKEAMEKYRE